jgi:hypothetical protein
MAADPRTRVTHLPPPICRCKLDILRTARSTSATRSDRSSSCCCGATRAARWWHSRCRTANSVRRAFSTRYAANSPPRAGESTKEATSGCSVECRRRSRLSFIYSTVGSRLRSSIDWPLTGLMRALADCRQDFMHGTDYRIWSFHGNSMPAAGHQHLPSSTRALRKSSLEVYPSSSYARFE